jgi:hypothetical protein
MNRSYQGLHMLCAVLRSASMISANRSASSPQADDAPHWMKSFEESTYGYATSKRSTTPRRSSSSPSIPIETTTAAAVPTENPIMPDPTNLRRQMPLEEIELHRLTLKIDPLVRETRSIADANTNHRVAAQLHNLAVIVHDLLQVITPPRSTDAP